VSSTVIKQIEVKVWEKLELTFKAEKSYANPYTDVEVWVDLQGPGFSKRVYGFWDGANIFRVRVVATATGKWSFVSYSNQKDKGLNDKKGSFNAVEWTEEEKDANPCRRGFIKANKHIFEYADGTPYFLLADTWWSVPTFRYPWYDDDIERPIGPEMGFKDMVKFRKEQGFNAIGIIAAFPQWANDRLPHYVRLDDEEKTGLRDAWKIGNTELAKDMYNEGGRPFLFPGKVPGYEDIYPDIDRLNPEYFKYMDRKIDYLNEQGFIPFIEVSRRDASEIWKKFYEWPISYTRFIEYIFSRYQANNCLLSPIHFDGHKMTIPPKEFNEPINMVMEKYGAPPFGTLLGANASPSTLINFGDQEDAEWLTFHQIGNWREHVYYWYLTEIYHHPVTKPALNGEPYYPGFPDNNPPADSETSTINCRSGMYGSILSGGLAGYFYGAEGLWGGDIEKGAKYRMWEALKFDSGAQVQHLKTFLMSQGRRYEELIPNAELLVPNKAGDSMGYRGWAYAARTQEKNYFLCYFEKDCLLTYVRGAEPNKEYKADWFDPRTGKWLSCGKGEITADAIGRLYLPKFLSNEDWGLRLLMLDEFK
jgi:hypothetical protein